MRLRLSRPQSHKCRQKQKQTNKQKTKTGTVRLESQGLKTMVWSPPKESTFATTLQKRGMAKDNCFRTGEHTVFPLSVHRGTVCAGTHRD
ncbi:rCG34181 [Rattus norvegicus]|uniref:RCG34181 n=1 Tax=Rattus norvegicus TaxID=10116 RepID=A6HKD5_RAT|nr:rCG34181 [Rattus norvegicus]